ncbi:MAG TPA: RHS repeat-associated core domain-containing protein [Armatimonadota bacterium]|nr:RHS repeat-associated core domain-containing protein [Armatimonadota bacterium]
MTSYVGPGLISKIVSTTRAIYHADGIGSTRAMTDSDQAVTMACIYDAYGNLLAEYPSSSAQSLGYAGQDRYYADSTGLDYLKARYYDPAVGRFISRDPIGYEGGLNLYGYVAGVPTVAVDPQGTSAAGDALGAAWGFMKELPDAWAGVYGSGAGEKHAWCVLKCGLNYALGFQPIPVSMDFGVGFSGFHFEHSAPAWFGVPGSPIFRWPVGRPPGNWVTNPGYWRRVRPAFPGFGNTPGPSGWRKAGRMFGPTWQVINLGLEVECLSRCLKKYKCDNGGRW